MSLKSEFASLKTAEKKNWWLKPHKLCLQSVVRHCYYYAFVYCAYLLPWIGIYFSWSLLTTRFVRCLPERFSTPNQRIKNEITKEYIFFLSVADNDSAFFLVFDNWCCVSTLDRIEIRFVIYARTKWNLLLKHLPVRQSCSHCHRHRNFKFNVQPMFSFVELTTLKPHKLTMRKLKKKFTNSHTWRFVLPPLRMRNLHSNNAIITLFFFHNQFSIKCNFCSIFIQ